MIAGQIFLPHAIPIHLSAHVISTVAAQRAARLETIPMQSKSPRIGLSVIANTLALARQGGGLQTKHLFEITLLNGYARAELPIKLWACLDTFEDIFELLQS